MFWEDWPRADQLVLLGIGVAILSLFATVFITWLVYRLSSRSDAVGQQALEKMGGIQAQLHGVVQRNRRDELIERLRSETNSEILRVLRAEVDQSYTGDDRAILRSVYRANKLTPLPSSELVSERELEDFLPSIPERLARQDNQRDAVIRFVAATRRSGHRDRHRVASALYKGSTTESILPRAFFRAVVVEDWSLAPHLINLVASEFDWESPARSTNLLTGVFVGLIDIDPRSTSSGRGRPLSSDEDAQLQGDMLQSLAGLLHYGPLTGLGSLDRERPMYERGSSESLSTLVAWLIRAAGNAVQHDQHLEMRVMESLAGVVRSLRESNEWQGLGGGWGIDVEDVQVGMLRMRHKCPRLWMTHGDDLIAVTGVALEPVITRKRDGQPLTLGPFDLPDPRWPEVYDAAEG